MNNYIEIYINNKFNEIPKDEISYINNLLPFYLNIKNNNLANLFAYYHYKLNYLFSFMNDKLSSNNHFNAHESRGLINIINNIENIAKELKNTEYILILIHTIQFAFF